jgi:hypothetical protein
MINPLVTLRMEAGFSSPKQLARYMSVAPATIEHIEYGMVKNVPEHYLSALQRRSPDILVDNGYRHLTDLEDDFAQFKSAKRLGNFGLLLLKPNFFQTILKKANLDSFSQGYEIPIVHPLVAWINQTSPTPSLHGLAVGFCLNVGQLNRFINKSYNFTEPMPAFMEALQEAGYSQLELNNEPLLDVFTRAFLGYREYSVGLSYKENSLT